MRLDVPDRNLSVIVEGNADDLCSLSVTFNVGSRHEPELQNGITHLCEHVMTCGGGSTPDLQSVSDFLIGNSCMLEAYTHKERLTFQVTTRSGFVSKAIKLLEDLTLSPTLGQNSVKKEKQTVLNEIDGNLQNLVYITDLELGRHIWQGTSLASPINGNRETVQGMTPADVCAWYEKRIRTSPVSVACVGGIANVDDLTQTVVEKFGKRKEITKHADAASDGPKDRTGRATFRNLDISSRYGCLVVGFPIDQWTLEQYLSMLYLKNVICEQGHNSLLNKLFRNDQQLVYHFGAYIQPYQSHLKLVIYMLCDETSAPFIVETLFASMDSLTTLCPPDFAASKRYATLFEKVRLQNISLLAKRLSTLPIEGLPDDYLSRIDELSMLEVSRTLSVILKNPYVVWSGGNIFAG